MKLVSVRQALETDIQAMVSLSYNKRRMYEKARSQFWRYAEGAEEVQEKWFKNLLNQKDHILLVADSENKIVGFIIGCITKAPEVYNPAGFILMVDDFCVASPAMWQPVGSKLLAELKRVSQDKGASQVIVACGAHDEYKQQLLKNLNLKIASEWYWGAIS